MVGKKVKNEEKVAESPAAVDGGGDEGEDEKKEIDNEESHHQLPKIPASPAHSTKSGAEDHEHVLPPQSPVTVTCSSSSSGSCSPSADFGSLSTSGSGVLTTTAITTTANSNSTSNEWSSSSSCYTNDLPMALLDSMMNDDGSFPTLGLFDDFDRLLEGDSSLTQSSNNPMIGSCFEEEAAAEAFFATSSAVKQSKRNSSLLPNSKSQQQQQKSIKSDGFEEYSLDNNDEHNHLWPSTSSSVFGSLSSSSFSSPPSSPSFGHSLPDDINMLLDLEAENASLLSPSSSPFSGGKSSGFWPATGEAGHQHQSFSEKMYS